MSLICIAAGGTGGHIFPAATLAGELRARGHRIHVLTDARGQAYVHAFDDAPVTEISAGAVVGKSPLHQIKSILSLLKGVWQARRMLADHQPSLVIGFGGYPSIAPLIAAWTLGIPSLLHEQNAIMGLANRLASHFVSKIALSFPGTHGQSRPAKAQLVGNPVRSDFANLPAYETPKAGPIHLLVFGGSQGAKIMADLVPAGVAALPADLRKRLHLTLQLREEDHRQAHCAMDTAGLGALDIRAFLDPMPAYLAKAHLVIARSGATTVCEIAVAGRPALLIPLALQADAQQARNAQPLQDAGGAEVLVQTTLTPDSLSGALKRLLSAPETLNRMAQSAKDVGLPMATRDLADLALTLIPSQETPQ